MNPRKVLMPSFAFLRSVQFGSFDPLLNWHMEPVRSRTSMMSSGLAVHGEHAVAVARTVSLSIPRMRAKTVGTSEVARTLSALYELKDVEHPGADWTQRIVTVVVTGAPVVTAFGLPC